MGRAAFVSLVVALTCAAAIGRNDDDFAFESNEEFQLELTANHSEITRNGLKKLWGVPDATAYAEHLFRMEIPREAFTGEVSAYKVRSSNGRPIPSWLAVDARHGLLSGVAPPQQAGEHALQVTAHGNTRGLTATDTFTIHVKPSSAKSNSKYGVCSGQQKRLVAALIVDRPLHRISTKQRIKALMGLAHFMALDGDEFRISSYTANPNHQVVMSGPGDSRNRRDSKELTGIYWNVGCDTTLWPRHLVLVSSIREQARDGSLSQVLGLPVHAWTLTSQMPQNRRKRQSSFEGSGDNYDDNYDAEDDAEYSGYDDNDNENDDDDYTRIDQPSQTVETPSSTHPHRHHHGEVTDNQPPTTPIDPSTTPTEPPTIPTEPSTTPTEPPTTRTEPSTTPTEPPTTRTEPTEDITVAGTTVLMTNPYTTENHKIQITPYSETASEANSVVNMTAIPDEVAPRLFIEKHSPIVIVPEEMTTSTEAEQTVIILPANELPSPSSSETSSTMGAPQSTAEPPTTRLTTKPTTAATIQTTPSTVQTTPSTVQTTPTMVHTTPIMVQTTPTMVQTTQPAVPSTTMQMTTPIPPLQETTTEEQEEFEEDYETEVTEKETQLTSTEKTSTIIGRTTETVTFAMPVNQPPTLNHHMKKLAITAGKAFRYIIPADLFTDPEEGTNLTFTMYENDNAPLRSNSWIQFIPTEREVYGLPLEAHVSRWYFSVEARDSEGLAARGPLDITVQQHKQHRNINHQFNLQFKLMAPYKNSVDWQIRALEGIVNLFRDTDMDHLTVLNATQNGDMCEFVWTNDTLPRDTDCPKEDIKRLMAIMESSNGNPSAGLARAMSPQLKVSSVTWGGRGGCARALDAAPADTYPPVTRNQVDHVTAAPGHLLIYKVPEDTFFDPEDGGTRNLHLSLTRGDRSPLPASHWLQFDDNNQEFYGLPMTQDEGLNHYQLIAEDSSKKSAYDSLIVEVVKAPTIRPTVEFQMTMEYPYELLATSAANKRKVVEKLAALFGASSTESIRIKSITDNPTTIIWYNTSLPMDRCPKKEIESLRQMIISEEKGTHGGALKDAVDQIFDKDLKVMSIRLVPLGLCAEYTTRTKSAAVPPQSAHRPPSSDNYTEYLVTFIIPAIVVVCMIVVATVIACVLYRRRRTGKMSVGDEEERQAFRSKGIPVIFQDELEERGDTEPVHKSPVIMREEKPPLLPPAPEYRTGEDAPYRPPPPFASTRTPPRPKATPTYRKPPPYVPP